MGRKERIAMFENVSVPFRGYVVVIGDIRRSNIHNVVSVPFRGYVVVMIAPQMDVYCSFGFRPLSGLCSSN